MRCLAYRAQKMVLHQRSVTLVPNLLNGARSGPATGRMFAIAVTVVAKQKSDACGTSIAAIVVFGLVREVKTRKARQAKS